MEDILEWRAYWKGKKILVDGMRVKHYYALGMLLQVKKQDLMTGILRRMGFTPHVKNPYLFQKYRSGKEPVIWFHKTFRPDSNYLDFSASNGNLVRT